VAVVRPTRARARVTISFPKTLRVRQRRTLSAIEWRTAGIEARARARADRDGNSESYRVVGAFPAINHGSSSRVRVNTRHVLRGSSIVVVFLLAVISELAVSIVEIRDARTLPTINTRPAVQHASILIEGLRVYANSRKNDFPLAANVSHGVAAAAALATFRASNDSSAFLQQNYLAFRPAR